MKQTSSFRSSVMFAKVALFKPFNGFYELKYEGRGTVAAGILFLLLYYISSVIRAMYTGYIFNPSRGNPVNLGMIFLQSVMPLVLFCIANWCLTLMLDGEGTMDQIFMGLCYAVVPLISSNILCTVLSNLIIAQEGMYLELILGLALLWTGFLIVVSVMQINQYTFMKAVVACLLSIVGVAIILLIFLLCFNLIQQMFAFFQSVYKELSYR